MLLPWIDEPAVLLRHGGSGFPWDAEADAEEPGHGGEDEPTVLPGPASPCGGTRREQPQSCVGAPLAGHGG